MRDEWSYFPLLDSTMYTCGAVPLCEIVHCTHVHTLYMMCILAFGFGMSLFNKASPLHSHIHTHQHTCSTHSTCSVWVQCRSERGTGLGLLSSSSLQHTHWTVEVAQEETAERGREGERGMESGVKRGIDNNLSQKNYTCRLEKKKLVKQRMWHTYQHKMSVCTRADRAFNRSPKTSVLSLALHYRVLGVVSITWLSHVNHVIVTCMKPTYLLRSAGSTMSVVISASRIEMPGERWQSQHRTHLTCYILYQNKSILHVDTYMFM